MMKVTAKGLVFVDHEKQGLYLCYSATDLSETEVAICRAHLSKYWEPAKTVSMSSYGLKHRAEWIGGAGGGRNPNEKYGGRHISNGSLIQAAIDLGLRVEPDGGGINARVYVKQKKNVL